MRVDLADENKSQKQLTLEGKQDFCRLDNCQIYDILNIMQPWGNHQNISLITSGHKRGLDAQENIQSKHRNKKNQTQSERETEWKRLEDRCVMNKGTGSLR